MSKNTLPQPSSIWRDIVAVEIHVARRTPLYDYLTARRDVNDSAPRAWMIRRLDNGDLMARFKLVHYQRAIEYIWSHTA